jgi:hypothetical protein
MKSWAPNLALVLLLLPASAIAQAEAEQLRTAKALFLDRQYAEARSRLRGLRGHARGGEVGYWIAHCGRPRRAGGHSAVRRVPGRRGSTTLAQEAAPTSLAVSWRRAAATSTASPAALADRA